MDSKQIIEKYGLTKELYVGVLETCQALNEDPQLKDMLVVGVPFWFVDQYSTVVSELEALNKEVEVLTAKLEGFGKVKIKKERTNIITGVTSPYEPGVTGPRAGDLHLDKDHHYSKEAIRADAKIKKAKVKKPRPFNPYLGNR